MGEPVFGSGPFRCWMLVPAYFIAAWLSAEFALSLRGEEFSIVSTMWLWSAVFALIGVRTLVKGPPMWAKRFDREKGR